MRLKPKTVRRMTLLGAVALLVVGAVFSLFVVRQWQKARTIDRFAREATEDAARGRYYPALITSANYLKRSPASHERYAEMLKTYADCRMKVEEADHSHVRQAVVFYHRYLEQRPDDRATQELLLELLLQCGFWAEARELAGALAPRDLASATEADAKVLRCEAVALYAGRTGPDRLFAILERLAELQPLNLRNETIRLQALAQAGRQAEGRARAEALLAAHPADPRAELVLVLARMLDRRTEEAQDQWARLCRAAGLEQGAPVATGPLKYPDQAFAETLIEIFDEIAAYGHAVRVLEEAAVAFDAPALRRMLVRRLWQENRHEDVLKHTEAIDPGSQTVDAELAGFRGLSLVALGRSPDALALAEALAKKDGDYRATTWSKAVPLQAGGADLKQSERIERAREIVKTSPAEPVFLVMLGDALASVGRTDEARRYWEDAARSERALAWPVPKIKVAETCLAEGRYDAASHAATEALRTAPNAIAVNHLWIETQTALIQRGSREAPAASAVLDRIDRLLEGVGASPHADAVASLRDRLLPVRVLLMSRAGDREKAIAVARGALGGGPALSEDSLRRLGAVSEAEHLGIDGECLAQAESRFGESAAVALARALASADAGNAEAALQRLREAAGARAGDLGYEIALAKFLERTGRREEALREWAGIGERHAGSLEAQRACLTSEAAVADRPFIEKTIQRYTGLMGPDAVEDYYARMARARAQARQIGSRRERDEVVSTLTTLVAANPSLVEPRLLLASVLAMSDPARDIRPDLARAVAQLRDAAAKEPRSARVAIELARLHQAQRDWDQARLQLHRVANDATFDANSRAEAARLLIAQGEPGPVAVGTLEQLAARLGDRAEPALLLQLAEAHAALRQDQKAEEIYASLVRRAADPDSLLMAARFYARRGDRARAEASLARLDGMSLSPGTRELTLARFAAEEGSPEEARAAFEAAVGGAPRRVEGWRHYAMFLIARGDHAGAAAVVDRGLAANAGDTSLATLREQARLLASGDDSSDLTQLIESLARDPATVEASQTLRLIQQARARGDLENADELARLADRHPGSAPLQMFVARRLASGDLERAASIANRALSAAPSDPAPARLAAEMYLQLGRWGDMLRAAEAWRQRDTGRGREADLAVAEAHFHLGQHQRGLEVLEPRVERALATPGDRLSLGVLNMRARLLVGAGRTSEARDLLAPLLPGSRDVRLALWLSIAGRDVPGYEEARAWIEQVRPLLSTESADEQLVLVMVLDSLSTRFPERADALMAESLEVLTRLANSPRTATGVVLEALGILRHRMQDLTGAEAAYQRAIELDPARAVAMNNLSSIELETRGNVEEALRLARRAVELQPLAAHLDTLARAQRAAAERLRAAGAEGARAGFVEAGETYLRAAGAAPGDPGPLASAAHAFELGGELSRAAECYETLIRDLSGRDAAYAKNNLAGILTRVNTPESLARARALALEATRTAPEPATYDTLGWVELALGERERAAEQFRRALGARGERAPLASAAVGLALSAGSSEQKREAAAALSGVKREAVAPDLLEQYDRARQAVGAPLP